MSKLPNLALPTDVVDVGGTEVEIRSLSRAEAMRFASAFTEEAMPGVPLDERAGLAEIYLLSLSVGVSEDEAKTWRESTDAAVSGPLIDRICELSGLATKEDDGKNPQSDTSEPSSKERSTPSTTSSRKLSVA